MTVVQAFPSHGDVFFDVRDDGRNLRINWHHERDLVVLSTWRHGTCIASCQIDRSDVPNLISQLVDGLSRGAASGATEGQRREPHCSTSSR
jgi:hypothetical protein